MMRLAHVETMHLLYIHGTVCSVGRGAAPPRGAGPGGPAMRGFLCFTVLTA